MAKGRKLSFSRSERYLYGYNHGQVTEAESPELREDDVWSTITDDHANNYDEWAPRVDSNGVHHRHVSRGTGRQHGGLSLAFDDDSGKMITTATSRIVHRGMDSPRGRHVATSAPVNVPDWSKIYRADSVESLHDSDDVDDNEYEMVPPHEYLAQEYRKMNTTSVLEGVGRTLKGRDLSRVRDAVWSQTGFDG